MFQELADRRERLRRLDRERAELLQECSALETAMRIVGEPIPEHLSRPTSEVFAEGLPSLREAVREQPMRRFVIQSRWTEFARSFFADGREHAVDELRDQLNKAGYRVSSGTLNVFLSRETKLGQLTRTQQGTYQRISAETA